MNLLAEKHTCPALAHRLATELATARSRSASDRTTKGSLPPSYITDLLRCLPAASAMKPPALVEPVKLTPMTSFLLRMRSSWSLLVNTFWYSPESNPASFMSCSIFSPSKGVESEVLTSTLLPSRRVGRPPLKARKKGKLKGTMKYTTPIGKYFIKVFTLASVFTWVGRISWKFLE